VRSARCMRDMCILFGAISPPQALMPPFLPRAAVEEVARATGALGLEDEADGFPPLPRLNIGGAEFQTRIAVLRSQPGSLLSECSSFVAQSRDEKFDCES
jgi:hypothetical protein